MYCLYRWDFCVSEKLSLNFIILILLMLKKKRKNCLFSFEKVKKDSNIVLQFLMKNLKCCFLIQLFFIWWNMKSASWLWTETNMIIVVDLKSRTQNYLTFIHKYLSILFLSPKFVSDQSFKGWLFWRGIETCQERDSGCWLCWYYCYCFCCCWSGRKDNLVAIVFNLVLRCLPQLDG